MEHVAQELRKESGIRSVSCAYLSWASPSVPEAIQALVKKGAKEIHLVPYFLLLGRHIKEDIPRIKKEARLAHHGRVKIKVCRYLGYDRRIVSLVKQRLRER